MNTQLQTQPKLTARQAMALDISTNFKKPNGDTDWQAGFVDHPRAKNLLGHNPASVMFALRQRGIGPGPKTTGNGKKVGRPSKMSLAARKRWAKHRAKLNGHDDE